MLFLTPFFTDCEDDGRQLSDYPATRCIHKQTAIGQILDTKHKGKMHIKPAKRNRKGKEKKK